MISVFTLSVLVRIHQGALVIDYLTINVIFVQAAALYKLVAERGPWGRLMRQALDFYIKGHVGKALLLYSRSAELGYEVGQSNAAWLLEKYRGGICLGSSGICTTEERHQRAHNLWRHASEQGNEHASLLLGDAYYYGRVCVQLIVSLCLWMS